jgi:hypothetical protein
MIDGINQLPAQTYKFTQLLTFTWENWGLGKKGWILAGKMRSLVETTRIPDGKSGDVTWISWAFQQEITSKDVRCKTNSRMRLSFLGQAGKIFLHRVGSGTPAR